jgi:hypothetical protein
MRIDGSSPATDDGFSRTHRGVKFGILFALKKPKEISPTRLKGGRLPEQCNERHTIDFNPVLFRQRDNPSQAGNSIV